MRLQIMAVMAILAAVGTGSSFGGQSVNLVRQGGFEQRDLTLSSKDEPGVWHLFNHGADVFELRLEGWTDRVEIRGRNGDPIVPLTTEGTGTKFRVSPGQYRLTRVPPGKH